MQLLKKITLLLMLVAVVLQSFSTLLAVVSFELNRSYIAESLCVNRNRPELNCNGQCVLMKNLKAKIRHADEQEKQTLQQLLDETLTLFYPKNILITLDNQDFKHLKNNVLIPKQKNEIACFFVSALLRPPIFA
jgi:hypothetical protein